MLNLHCISLSLQILQGQTDFAYDACTVRAGDDDFSDEGSDSDHESDADSAFSYDSRTAPTECYALDDDRLLKLEDATETFDLDESFDRDTDNEDY